MTEEEHKARAMLLGLCYHNGNGDEPFYYDAQDPTNWNRMLNAETLEPLVPPATRSPLDWGHIGSVVKTRRRIQGIFRK